MRRTKTQITDSRTKHKGWNWHTINVAVQGILEEKLGMRVERQEPKSGEGERLVFEDGGDLRLNWILDPGEPGVRAQDPSDRSGPEERERADYQTRGCQPGKPGSIANYNGSRRGGRLRAGQQAWHEPRHCGNQLGKLGLPSLPVCVYLSTYTHRGTRGRDSNLGAKDRHGEFIASFSVTHPRPHPLDIQLSTLSFTPPSTYPHHPSFETATSPCRVSVRPSAASAAAERAWS